MDALQVVRRIGVVALSVGFAAAVIVISAVVTDVATWILSSMTLGTCRHPKLSDESCGWALIFLLFPATVAGAFIGVGVCLLAIGRIWRIGERWLDADPWPQPTGKGGEGRST